MARPSYEKAEVVAVAWAAELDEVKLRSKEGGAYDPRYGDYGRSRRSPFRLPFLENWHQVNKHPFGLTWFSLRPVLVVLLPRSSP